MNLYYCLYTIKLIILNNKMGIGDWGLGIGDWAQSPIPKTFLKFLNSNLLINLLNKYY